MGSIPISSTKFSWSERQFCGRNRRHDAGSHSLGVLGTIVGVVALYSCQSSDSGPEHGGAPVVLDEADRAATFMRRCMSQSGLARTEISFDIRAGTLVDWNAVYPGVGGGVNDSIHNACIRRLIVEFNLATPNPAP